MKPGFADKLRSVSSPEEVIAVFDEAKVADKVAEKVVVAPSGDRPFIVVVTACTTGLHTHIWRKKL